MSCERNANKIAHLAARVAIPRLASKRAYYVGLAAGAAGLLAVVATRAVPRLRRVPSKRDTGDNATDLCADGLDLVTSQAIPALPSRKRVAPAPLDALAGKTCANCQATPQGKPGVWYVIGERAYCQDCAPHAAGEADVDLSTPSGPSPPSICLTITPPVGSTETDQQNKPHAILSAADPRKIRLQESPVEVKTTSGRARIARGAYLVTTRAGAGTGLAITPVLKKDDRGDLVTDPGQWVITHLRSGMAMAGPYSSIDETRRLASVLADIDWRREPDALSRRELAASRQIIEAYNQALAEARARSGDRALLGAKIQPTDLFQNSN
jgi:hypothetical protein